jgi:sugar phosphate isomerase/epimerase
VGEEAQDAIRILGHDRLKALHVHDNNYKEDTHTLPGLMMMNWDEITRALADIDYSGEFTYEADTFLKNFDNAFKPEAVRFMVKRGRDLIAKIEAHKQNN